MKRLNFIVLILLSITIGTYAQNNEKIRTLAVSGSGEVSVKPDIANINFNLSSTNLDFKKAIDELNTKVNSLSKALKKVGIPKDEIYSSNYNINKEYEHNYQTREKKFIGYKVSHSISVQTSSDTKSVNKVFEAIISSLNDVELTLSFGVKDSEKYKGEMLEKAIADAKQKAEIMAAAAGVKLTEIVKINYQNTPIHFSGNYNEIRLNKSAISAAPAMVEDFNPKDIKRSTNVNIVWRIN
ncbi:MAG: SIMPL domain-containing protein [Flavobacteriales bacterium]|nr:SIMPL domain-containing protein [Flavobacteriales bacterium]MCK5906802.1 SIMPL domain-containing protein [Flavobacteriales bacterium]